jgi:phosphate transport system protein
MVEKFHTELDELKMQLLKMGMLGADMLRKSIIALRDHDVELAKAVTARKGELARLDVEIEDKSLRVIALYQPVASDLRTIACILKMETYIARVGRYGKDIAQVAIELGDKPHPAKLVSIPMMADIASKMVEDALTAFSKKDLALVRDFKDKDDQLDAMRWSIFRECVTYMIEDPKAITLCAHLIMIARYLERCADHACKMAEKIHYMVTGEHIEVK